MVIKRRVKGLERYYRIGVFQNLFGEWTVVRVFGSTKRSKPTGEIASIYPDYAQALLACESLVKRKMKKGYTNIQNGAGEGSS